MAWISTQPDPAGFAKRPCIPPWTAREPEFERIFRAAWREQPDADPFQEQARFNSGLYTASAAVKILKQHTIDAAAPLLERLTAAIAALRMLTARPVNYDALDTHVHIHPFLFDTFTLDELPPMAEAKVRDLIVCLLDTSSPEGERADKEWHCG